MNNNLPQFGIGDIVSFADIEAVVLQNFDTDIYVKIPGEGFCKWRKVFEGETVKLVKRGNNGK